MNWDYQWPTRVSLPWPHSGKQRLTILVYGDSSWWLMKVVNQKGRTVMVTVNWVTQLLLRPTLKPLFTFTRYKSTRVGLPFCLSWCLVPYAFPPQPYSDFKILLPKVFERHAVLAISFSLEKSALNPLSCLLDLFQFSSPLKTWSSWYLTSLRKVYALLQVNRFFRTLAKSSVHNLDASLTLQNYAEELKRKKKKSLGEWVPLDPGDSLR